MKGSAFLQGQFELSSLGDTFLDMRGWGKGHVWLNGYNLGPMAKKGNQPIIVLHLEPIDRRTVQAIGDPIWSRDMS